MIKFVNPGVINPLSFSVLGVNAKPNVENSIGQFGTGAKYSIAIILRLGGRITIKTSEGSNYAFSARERDFRGEKIQQVYSNEVPLGFTTKLGEHWEPWMAYRELYTNMLDENGAMDTDPRDRGWDEWTSVEVQCKQIEHEFDNHWKYFLSSTPIIANNDIELHNPIDHGRMYYKGVLVKEDFVFPYNINVISNLGLTEDRTVKNDFTAQWGIASLLSDSDNEDVLRKIMTVVDENNDYMRKRYIPDRFSDTAIRVAQEILQENPQRLQPSIKSKLQERKEIVYEEKPFTPTEQKMLTQALEKLGDNNINVSADIVKTTVAAPNLVGFWSHRVKKIFLTDVAFQKGLQFLTTTLIEENAHSLGYYDESRRFQDYLMDLIYQNLK